MRQDELKEFLESKVIQYNQPSFIESDPIQIPHAFTKKEDIEIASFLTATIAWGQRQTIINNAWLWMKLMDNAPADFIKNFTENDLDRFMSFKHRTFNSDDCIYFLKALKNIYANYSDMETLFYEGFYPNKSLADAIIHFRKVFFTFPGIARTQKHIPDITRGASAKRLNLFLRWMVRKDKQGVDFGIWNSIPASALYLPLDVHSGNTARKLNLLLRKSNDWKAVEEVTTMLRRLDLNDPVKYDYALFGLGIFEGF